MAAACLPPDQVARDYHRAAPAEAIVWIFLVEYLYRKGHFNSAATEQACPEIQLHAVEPVSGAEPQGALGLETTPKQATAVQRRYRCLW